MEVNIKKLEVAMKVKNKGVEFDVYNGETFLGDFIVSKTGITWCKGKTSRAKGMKISWKTFIELMEQQ